MKIYRKVLRFWIAFASVVTFLGGWVILAHSPKPVQPQANGAQAAAALPSLPPIQAFTGNANTNGPSFFSSNNSQSNTSPVMQPSSGQTFLRTRGS